MPAKQLISKVSSPLAAEGRFWVRVTGLFLGLGILIWLTIEEQSELFVVAASGAVCAWIASRLLLTLPHSDRQLILRHGLVGLGTGLLVAPIAILLMAIKSGIHSHNIPEFSVAQMQSVLLRIPYFIVSGFLIALGFGLWRLVKRSDIVEEQDDG
jgi:hypothetical protein